MKFITVQTFIVLLFLSIAGHRAHAQDPTQQVQEFTIKIDELGDADYELKSKMTAQQWESFKRGPLVNDPAIARRDLQRAMSSYVIEDFKRDVDDMNRTVKMTLKVKAMAQYKGDGKWEIRLDSKDPQITKLSDNSFMTTSNVMIGGQLTQQVFKVFFPGSAGNIQQGTDSFGKAIFTYSSGGAIRAMLAWNNIAGILLIAAAVVVFLRSRKRSGALSLSNVMIHPTPTVNTEKTN